MKDDIATSITHPVVAQTVTPTNYSVEFFHIYTDETINDTHRASLDYLREASQAWTFDYKLILFVDDYNPEKHILSAENVLKYLDNEKALPDFWAYEGDMLANAEILLDNLTSIKIKKNYVKYIQQHGKYPCSLLSATWYLTRLGALPHEVIKSTSTTSYEPASRLINILPEGYKSVEKRALELIKHSEFASQLDNIQDLFIQTDAGRAVSLW